MKRHFGLFLTWPTWNNRKTLNLSQISISKWRFRCSNRSTCLNCLICRRYLHVHLHEEKWPRGERGKGGRAMSDDRARSGTRDFESLKQHCHTKLKLVRTAPKIRNLLACSRLKTGAPLLLLFFSGFFNPARIPKSRPFELRAWNKLLRAALWFQAKIESLTACAQVLSCDERENVPSLHI